jgi:hypothetical protein
VKFCEYRFQEGSSPRGHLHRLFRPLSNYVRSSIGFIVQMLLAMRPLIGLNQLVFLASNSRLKRYLLRADQAVLARSAAGLRVV